MAMKNSKKQKELDRREFFKPTKGKGKNPSTGRNVMMLASRWQSNGHCNIKYRPSQEQEVGAVTTLMYCYQATWQARLLNLYGHQMTLLVGFFIVQHETAADIKEAMEVFRGWNPSWRPSHFMVDFSQAEINVPGRDAARRYYKSLRDVSIGKDKGNLKTHRAVMRKTQRLMQARYGAPQELREAWRRSEVRPYKTAIKQLVATLKKRQDIVLRKPDPLDRARKDSVDEFFLRYRQVLAKYGLEKVPRRIYNAERRGLLSIRNGRRSLPSSQCRAPRHPSDDSRYDIEKKLTFHRIPHDQALRKT
ncbi:hypothetical protein Bbelb_278420 [Branchiostoma belcheri]|nr:hypothetical protein Bbelb_278420 [Branchiostoma belcheri]